jgi:hypothetical protein
MTTPKRWSLVCAAFDHAVNLDSEHLHDYLAELVARDAGLAADVETLLRADARTAGFLDRPVLAAGGPDQEEFENAKDTTLRAPPSGKLAHEASRLRVQPGLPEFRRCFPVSPIRLPRLPDEYEGTTPSDAPALDVDSHCCCGHSFDHGGAHGRRHKLT